MALDLKHIESEITSQYLYDENPERPWIVGFSGGKDSTMLLQLVWNAVKKLPPELRKRRIHVVCNNTLVENPRIINFIERTLQQIEQEAVPQSMPVEIVRTRPKLEDTFWVNLLGKGYPAPSNSFRWCTERMKINPTTRFIKQKVSEKGEAIILLGTRSDESASRARSIKKHEIQGQRLRKHILPNAFVFAPIVDVTTQELWQYLMQVSPPWGGTHKELVTLYKNANSGDCPLVIDNTTPSCGNSRFGCWVCTVVQRDRSMEGLIENGEDWMYPLMEIRDILAESKERDDWRQDVKRDGTPGKGPYLPHIRAWFLQKILEAQKEINEEYGEMDLINHQELVAIQMQWYRDGIYNQSVSDIYNNIFNDGIDMSEHSKKIKEEEELLKNSCNKDEKDYNLIKDLLKLQKTKSLMKKKRGLQSDLENRIESFIQEH